MDKNYILLNNKVNMKDKEGNYINLDLDGLAVKEYFLNNINQNTVFFHSLEEKLDYLVREGYYDKKVLDKYTMEDIKNIFKIAYDKKIRFRSYTGAVTFYERYAMRTKDNERILERYEDRLSMIALTIGRNFEEAKEFINILANRQLQGATPVFMNAGKLRGGGLVSCYLLDINDNLESINYTMNSAMQMSKIGGGVGLNLNRLRARGETIKGIEERASGVLPPSKVFEDIFSYINQLGQRSGSGVVHLSIFHNDIEEFINSKKVNADEKLRLKTLSTAIIIPDKFMEILKDSNTRYYYTFYPKNVYDITGIELDDMDMSIWYNKLVENKNIKKTQRDKLKIVQEMIKSQKESGYSYIIFIDTMNREHNLKQIGRINMSNLCVAPYTKILTKEYGYIEIGSIENQLVNVWNGEQWSETVIKKTGENQKLIRVITSTNNSIDCTPYHKFYVYGLKSNGDVDNNKIIEKKASELLIDDKLITYKLPKYYNDIHSNKNLDYPYLNGFFTADGTDYGTKYIYLYGEKKKLIHKFKNIKRKISKKDDGLQICMNGYLKDKFFIPKEYNLKSKIEWLSGLFDGDGHITNYKTGHQSFDLVSINKDFLIEVHYMLQELGVDNRIINGREERKEIICNKKANCKKQYRLKIGQRGINRLIELNISTERLKFKYFKINKIHKRLSKIISIEKLEGLHDTYCFTEPLRNMGMFNGMLLGNCTEIAQLNSPNKFDKDIYSGTNEYGYDIQCVLSSLNLVNLFECETDEQRRNVIISSMKFLSNVSDLSNIESVPSVNKSRDDFHSVGLKIS